MKVSYLTFFMEKLLRSIKIYLFYLQRRNDYAENEI